MVFIHGHPLETHSPALKLKLDQHCWLCSDVAQFSLSPFQSNVQSLDLSFVQAGWKELQENCQ